eukprot:14957439-Alexandrium_andersonii.AAC.1
MTLTWITAAIAQGRKRLGTPCATFRLLSRATGSRARVTWVISRRALTPRNLCGPAGPVLLLPSRKFRFQIPDQRSTCATASPPRSRRTRAMTLASSFFRTPSPACSTTAASGMKVAVGAA